MSKINPIPRAYPYAKYLGVYYAVNNPFFKNTGKGYEVYQLPGGEQFKVMGHNLNNAYGIIEFEPEIFNQLFTKRKSKRVLNKAAADDYP